MRAATSRLEAAFGSISFAFSGAAARVALTVRRVWLFTARFRVFSFSLWAARFFACFVLAIVSFRVGLSIWPSASRAGGVRRFQRVSEPSARRRWRALLASSDVGYSWTTNWSWTIACAFSPRSRWARAFRRWAEGALSLCG